MPLVPDDRAEKISACPLIAIIQLHQLWNVTDLFKRFITHKNQHIYIFRGIQWIVLPLIRGHDGR